MEGNLNVINERLIPKFEKGQLGRECEKIIEYNDNIVRAVTRLKQRVKQHSEIDNVPIRTQQSSPPVPPQFEGRLQDNERNLTVRLPKLYISKFDGDIASWPSF